MSESSFDMDFEDIDEGTSVASIAHSSVMHQSIAPQQPEVIIDDDPSIEVGESNAEEIEKLDYLKNGAGKPSKQPTTDFSNISHFPLGLPQVTKQTVDSNTYDLDYLLDFHIQRRAHGNHRFALSPTPSGGYTSTISKSRTAKSKPRMPEDSLDLFTSTITNGNCNVKERFWDKAAQTQAKLQGLRLDKEEVERAACTFTPSINEASYQRRSNSEFADSITDFIKSKNEKIEALRASITPLVVERSFTPELCKRSRTIVERRGLSVSSSTDRLHMRKRSLLDMRLERVQEAEVFNFSPVINKRSSALKRDEGHLSFLASPRGIRAGRPNSPIEELDNRPAKFMAKKSEAILMRRLLTDFEHCTTEYEGSRLNYTQAKELMEKLQFTSSYSQDSLVDMWKQLQGDAHNSIKKPILLQFLGAVMGLELPQGYIDDKDRVSKEQRELWHRQFIEFYQYRSIQVPADKRLKDLFVRPCFTPTLDDNSRRLHEKVNKARKEETNRHSIGDFLLNENHERQTNPLAPSMKELTVSVT